jgi:hypothetical protein
MADSLSGVKNWVVEFSWLLGMMCEMMNYRIIPKP